MEQDISLQHEGAWGWTLHWLQALLLLLTSTVMSFSFDFLCYTLNPKWGSGGPHHLLTVFPLVLFFLFFSFDIFHYETAFEKSFV